EPRSRPMGVRAPATITELFGVEAMSCDPLTGLHGRGVNEGLPEGTERYATRHRAVGVIARTLRDRPYGAPLNPC
ncbi:hypothetical protein NGM37_03045, partial [Streptomyces sp. TRM76130]|nr:hypothetical protein [Streptomyces sp. TRM76130]